MIDFNYIYTHAWFNAQAATGGKTASISSNKIGVEATKATVDSVIFTPTVTTQPNNVVLTEDGGTTAYFVNGTLYTNQTLDTTKNAGYTPVVFKVEASVATGSTLNVNDALSALYNSIADHKVYLRVKAEGHARVSTTDSLEGACAAAAHQATVTVELTLTSDGSQTEWSNLTVYASVKGDDIKDSTDSTKSVAELTNTTNYNDAILSATVGSLSADFEPAA